MIILSDIHSNIEALEAVLKIVHEDRIIILGDVVGYGADPGICLERVNGIIKPGDYVMGNHEMMVIDEYLRDDPDVNPLAKEGALFSLKILSYIQKEFIKSLPNSISIYDSLFVHGAPPDSYLEYLIPGYTSIQSIYYKFLSFKEQFCFIGHSHRPCMWIFNKEEGTITLEENFNKGIIIALKENERAIVNVGSVGQPRDRDNRAAFCIFDENKREVRLIRTEYDFNKTREKIIDAGLPKKLGDRLIYGY
ncbi:MAG: metallophosphoesterase family protein [Candidatus Hydrogenedentota bacterium]